ncbi:MAG: hypothetical protein H8E61_07745 [Bacteroidetes bacterium]|nr:hypothetical protein [Bacteroidota bacterium]
MMQGDGDYEEAKNWVMTGAVVGEQLKEDLSRLSQLSIPTDIIFKQGVDVLGL